MTAPLNHIHIYKRNKKHKNIFFCIQPDCYHRIDKQWLENKRALCPSCKSEYLLDKEVLRLALPKCPACRGGKKAEDYRSALSAVAKIIAVKAIEEHENAEPDRDSLRD